MTVDDLSTKLDAVLAAVQTNQSEKDAKIVKLEADLATALANAVDPAVIDGLGAKADAIQGALTATP